jgi:hypothetical protein
MSISNIPLLTGPGHRTLAERRAFGKGLREKVPRSSHAEWFPAADRPDPISLLEEQDRSRLAQIKPNAITPRSWAQSGPVVYGPRPGESPCREIVQSLSAAPAESAREQRALCIHPVV